ncbi:two-component system, response regulator YesN [Ruminococcaceae bacterium FB2012]|nr:two-component system, response regulator YesN [Ruminococcaceae bacterium FB2012]
MLQTSSADEFFSVKQLDIKKIEDLLRSGSLDSFRGELDGIFGMIKFSELRSLVLRLYVSTDIYIAARSFARDLGVSDSRFTALFGDTDDIEQKLSTIEGTTDYLYALAEQCIRWRIESGRDSGGGVVRKACAFIEENYMRDDISLNTVAREVGLSPTYFSALFKKETGRGLTEYLNMVRIDRSKQLLCCTSKMIYEIAFEVGFQDYRYFSQIFKKYTGQTPRQFQNAANVRT